MIKLKSAEEELQKMRVTLNKGESSASYQMPPKLQSLLEKTKEFEIELLTFKFQTIETEKNECSEQLEKISKRQGGLFGAFKIVHSTQLDEINNQLNVIK